MNKTNIAILAICTILIIVGIVIMAKPNDLELNKNVTNETNDSINNSIVLQLERPPFLDKIEGEIP